MIIYMYMRLREYPAQNGPLIMDHVLIGCGVYIILHLNSSQKVRQTLRSSSCMAAIQNTYSTYCSYFRELKR